MASEQLRAGGGASNGGSAWGASSRLAAAIGGPRSSSHQQRGAWEARGALGSGRVAAPPPARQGRSCWRMASTACSLPNAASPARGRHMTERRPKGDQLTCTLRAASEQMDMICWLTGVAERSILQHPAPAQHRAARAVHSASPRLQHPQSISGCHPRALHESWTAPKCPCSPIAPLRTLKLVAAQPRLRGRAQVHTQPRRRRRRAAPGQSAQHGRRRAAAAAPTRRLSQGPPGHVWRTRGRRSGHPGYRGGPAAAGMAAGTAGRARGLGHAAPQYVLTAGAPAPSPPCPCRAAPAPRGCACLPA